MQGEPWSGEHRRGIAVCGLLKTTNSAASSKQVEFILIGTMLANPDAVQCTNQEAYWPILQKVADAREGVAAVDMGGMHAFFLQHKNFQDMIANNINHPNDFLIRMYAMNLLATLIDYQA